MSAETDNLTYTDLCKWDSCFDCPHGNNCEDSCVKEEGDEE